MIADLVLADVVAEVAAAGVEGCLYFVEAVVEGRCRCSLGMAGRVEERSGHSSAVRSRVKTEVEGSWVTIVEEGSRAMLAEAVERLLHCELGASRDTGFWKNILFLPSGGAVQSVSASCQCNEIPRSSRGKYPPWEGALGP